MNWIYISREYIENENFYIIITSFMRNYLSTRYGQGTYGESRIPIINPSIQFYLIGSLHTKFTTPI